MLDSFFLLSPALQSHLFASSTTYRSRPVGVGAADHKLGFMDIYYSAVIDCGGQPARPPPSAPEKQTWLLLTRLQLSPDRLIKPD